MGELWRDESSVNHAYQPRERVCVSRTVLVSDIFALDLGSVVQSLRFNSSRMLPVVRSGFKCIFEFCQDRGAFSEGVLADEGIQAEPDEDDQEDVMNQLVDFRVRVEQVRGEQRKDCIEFDQVWDFKSLASISVLEAMQSNTIVRSLELFLDYISGGERSHLTAIVAALLKNDTLQSFSVWADYAIHCPFEAVSAAFERILKRNMCLRKLFVGPFDSLSDGPDLFFHDEADEQLPEPFIEDELRRGAWTSFEE